MRNIILLVLFLFFNTLSAQHLLVGLDLGTASSASFLHSRSTISDLTPDFVGLYYKADLMWDYRLLEIGYNISYDIIGIFGTSSINDYRFATTGFSIGFSTPLTKINGVGFRERRKMLRNN